MLIIYEFVCFIQNDFINIYFDGGNLSGLTINQKD